MSVISPNGIKCSASIPPSTTIDDGTIPTLSGKLVSAVKKPIRIDLISHSLSSYNINGYSLWNVPVIWAKNSLFFEPFLCVDQSSWHVIVWLGSLCNLTFEANYYSLRSVTPAWIWPYGFVSGFFPLSRVIKSNDSRKISYYIGWYCISASSLSNFGC